MDTGAGPFWYLHPPPGRWEGDPCHQPREQPTGGRAGPLIGGTSPGWRNGPTGTGGAWPGPVPGPACGLQPPHAASPKRPGGSQVVMAEGGQRGEGRDCCPPLSAGGTRRDTGARLGSPAQDGRCSSVAGPGGASGQSGLEGTSPEGGRTPTGAPRGHGVSILGDAQHSPGHSPE